MAVVNLYRVTWHASNHNLKDAARVTDLVVAAPNTGGSALGSLIQTQNNDGRTVAVDQVYVERTGILQ